MSENLSELQDENITNQINKMVEQVDSALAESAKSLTCGPDCQAQENIDNLRQIYLDAELNLQTAPTKLTVAEKNYLVSTLGESGYSDYMTTKLTVQSNKIGDKITRKFDNVVVVENDGKKFVVNLNIGKRWSDIEWWSLNHGNISKYSKMADGGILAEGAIISKTHKLG